MNDESVVFLFAAILVQNCTRDFTYAHDKSMVRRPIVVLGRKKGFMRDSMGTDIYNIHKQSRLATGIGAGVTIVASLRHAVHIILFWYPLPETRQKSPSFVRATSINFAMSTRTSSILTLVFFLPFVLCQTPMDLGKYEVHPQEYVQVSHTFP